MGERCFCCLTFRSGTLIIAILNIISSVECLQAVIPALMFLSVSPLYYGVVLNWQPAGIIIGILVYMLIAIADFIISCLLLTAYVQKSYRRCYPWLYWNCGALIIKSIATIIGIILLLTYAQYKIAVITLFIWVVLLSINIYFILTVWNYKQQLKGY